MPSLKSKKKRKQRAPPPASVPPSASPAAPSPSVANQPSPRESPLRRLLRRTSSSLGESWRELKSRRTSVSSVAGTGPRAAEQHDSIAPVRSRGSDAAPMTGHEEAGISRSGSLRGVVTPLRPRHDTSTPASAGSVKPGHHRTMSSLSSTFASSASPVSPATAQTRQSPVVVVETIASSSLPRAEQTEPSALALSDFGSIGSMHGRTSLGLDIEGSPPPADSNIPPLTPPTPPTHAPRQSAFDLPSLGPALQPPAEKQPSAIPETTPPPPPRTSIRAGAPLGTLPIHARHKAELGNDNNDDDDDDDDDDVFGKPLGISSDAPTARRSRSAGKEVSMSGWVVTSAAPGPEHELEEATLMRGGEVVGSRDESRMGEDDFSPSVKSLSMPKTAPLEEEMPKSPLLRESTNVQSERDSQVAAPATDQARKVSTSSAEYLDSISTTKESDEPTSQEPDAWSPPASPRLKPIASFPDAHVPEPTVLTGVAGGMQHAYVVPALEPVAEETPKATAVERFVGQAYRDERSGLGGKGVDRFAGEQAKSPERPYRQASSSPSAEPRHSASAISDGSGMSGTHKGKAADRSEAAKPGHKKLHAFEEIHTVKARQQASIPSPEDPGRPARTPSPSPLTRAPLDRASYPARPTTPSRIRWEPPRNRAQHTEYPALGAGDAHGTAYHEAGVGGMTFRQQGRVWIGRPPASLDGVAMRVVGARGALREGARDIEAPVAARLAADETETSTPATVAPRMLSLIPRFLSPRLTLDLQWHDSWLPADVRLETTAGSSAGVSISLSQTLRQWLTDAAAPPRTRSIRNMDTQRKE
ncbi:hypothetical protein NliqN6_1280 [Naganishia liquefaciens]|uniref:Uncharacterized protein n=1 Tax=Naganishia liquefaciens TaxID=104408 RepID=A0A8H3YD58_9TREE|nr:hypothetical protein NliqN6_1280 [Naganishia liquefaciens]